MRKNAQFDALKSQHVTPVDGNVFADLGFSEKEAVVLLADADARALRALTDKEHAALGRARPSIRDQVVDSILPPRHASDASSSAR